MAVTTEKAVMISREVERADVDLVDWLTDTAAQQFPDPKERFQALGAIAEMLIHGDPEYQGRRLLSYLQDPKLYRQDVIDAGLCPECLGELKGHDCHLHGEVA